MNFRIVTEVKVVSAHRESDMNARNFFDKVCMMRKYQKAYERTHSQLSYNQSKSIEKEIDAEIERGQNIIRLREQKEYEQNNLFTEN